MKETKKQIKAQVINEVKRIYDRKMEALQKSLDRWKTEAKMRSDACHDATVRARKLEKENNELKEKLTSYEEWIERMQDFCNLPEGERQQAFKTYLDGIKGKTDQAEAMTHLASFVGRISSLFTY